jgi:hypothetical protein
MIETEVSETSDCCSILTRMVARKDFTAKHTGLIRNYVAEKVTHSTNCFRTGYFLTNTCTSSHL